MREDPRRLLPDPSKFLHKSDAETDTYLVPADAVVRVVAVPHGTPVTLGSTPWAVPAAVPAAA